MVFCGKCGAEFNDEDNFCPKCGSKNIIKHETINNPNENVNYSFNFKKDNLKNKNKQFWKKIKKHKTHLIIGIIIILLIICGSLFLIEHMKYDNYAFKGEPTIKINNTYILNKSIETEVDHSNKTPEDFQAMSDDEIQDYIDKHTTVSEIYGYGPTIILSGLEPHGEYVFNITLYDSNGNIVYNSIEKNISCSFTADNEQVEKINNGSLIVGIYTEFHFVNVSKVKVQLLDEKLNLLSEDESVFTKEVSDRTKHFFNGKQTN